MLEKFIEIVVKEVENVYPDAKVSVHEVLKNNSVTYHGIHILRENHSVCPNIYLERFYDMYVEGTLDMEEIVKSICELHEEHTEEIQHMEIASWDFADVQERIVFRLVNTCMNQGILEESPNVPYLDMSILFYILVKQEEEHIGSVRITYALMETWSQHISIRELMRCAMRNMPRLFPARVIPILSIVNGEISDSRMFEFSVQDGLSYCGEYGFHSLSNHMGINGASAILYPGVLEEIAEYFESSLYVLPSSVHEVIILPAREEYHLQDLSAMVREINGREVLREEVLSNRAYYYDRQERALR